MIAYLEGRLEEKSPTRVVMDIGGIGYEVFIPLSTYDHLPAPGQTCRLLVHDHVREDARLLFGFFTAEEHLLFIRLLGVNGVGPKIALSALSGLSTREFKAAVVRGDAKILSSISGIGRKMAERLIVELRDKIDDGEALEAMAGGGEEGDYRLRDAVLALIALGYKQADARKLVSRTAAGPDDAVEDIVRRALTG